MKEFIKLPDNEKQQYFAFASSKLNIQAHIIEKDFWVCWVLQKLFNIDKVNKFLTFKGGTSLSKVYNVIERFSEDIDISIEKSFFDFNDDINSFGTKKRAKLLEELNRKCSYFVTNELVILLKNIIINESIGLVNVDETDKDKQTILFHYPSSYRNNKYVAPVVKIELGARSEHWPVSNKVIVPYLYKAIPESLNEHDVKVKVLNVERTFWEKATILHYYANYPSNKLITPRQSRHFYDFYCMIKSGVKELALSNLNLLNKVAEHKSLYFRCGWANYDKARKGTLKLTSSDRVLKEMKNDYGNMKEMIFGKIPDWDEIINTIKLFEKEFNSNGLNIK